MGVKKRNHVVPHMTLKAFSNTESLIWVYDRQNKSYTLQSPKDTAVRKNYYSFYTNTGERNRDIEEVLAEVEGLASKALKSLAQVTKISQHERKVISQYVAWQYTRTPTWQHTHEDMIEQLVKGVSSFFPDLAEGQHLVTWGDGSTPTPTEEKWDGVRVEVPRIMSLASMLQITPDLSNIISKLDWQVWVPPKRCALITSDNPFSLHPPPGSKEDGLFERGVGLLTPGALKIIPISSTHCLVMGEPGQRFSRNVINQKLTRQLNWMTAINSDRFIYGRSRELLESIVHVTRLGDRRILRDDMMKKK